MLRKVLIIAAAALISAPAFASYDEALERCEKFAADNDVSVDPCQCIAKAVSNDPALMEEDADIATMDDFQNASQAYKDAVNPCLPPDQQAK